MSTQELSSKKQRLCKTNAKNSQPTILPTKRKLSTNKSEEKIRNSKKQKTNEQSDLKQTKASVHKISNETKLVKEKISKDKKPLVKESTKRGKTSCKNKCSDESGSQGSSDELLSEIAKRKKIENVKKKAFESKTRKELETDERSVESRRASLLKGKPVVGKVNIPKTVKVTPVKNTGELLLKGSNEVITKVKEKSGVANINQSGPDNFDLKSNKNAKNQRGKSPIKGSLSPTKLDKGATRLKVAEAKHSDKCYIKQHHSVMTEEDKISSRVSPKKKEYSNDPSSEKEMSIERKVSKRNDFGSSDESGSEMEWEDVAEVSGMLDDKVAESEASSNNVEVTINVPGKKSKGGRPSNEEIRKWIQRKINRREKLGQIAAHKVHLLALLAIGQKKNEMCNNPLVQAVGLSLLPNVFIQRTALKTWDILFLTRITTWMKNKAPNPGEVHTGNSEATFLMRVLEKKVYFLIAVLRALGLDVRLIMSLQVLSHKVKAVNESSKPGAKPKKTPAKGKQTKPTATPKQSAKKQPKQETLLNKLKSNASPAKTGSPSTSRGLRKKSKVDYAEETTSEYFNKEGKTPNKSASKSLSSVSDDDDDFEVPLKSPKRGRTSSGESKFAEPLQDVPASGEPSGVIKKGRDIWIEVYLEKEKKWICIDGDISSINQPDECEKLATKPIKYAISFDNECSIKDVTCRYASGWLTTTAKLRVDPDWLTETLNFHRTKNLKRDKKEDSLLKARLQQLPLPTTVSEYKNHPLYVLKRHLLKFEAIYPATAATLGFCRGEAVYSRDCVHTLHTREIWLKEARVVKTGEQAYKIVKGRKTKRKMLENVGEIKAELFGEWQTEEYIPPPVVDGKVPRNEYGNVELFKPSMLPAGACHIQVPGIHRLARKLKIDAVPAVTGFDFHGGFNHPIIDGVVVSEEFKEQLLLAWDKEQQEKIQREQAKREKRALDNWRHLVRSLRIRERLKRKYSIEDSDDGLKSNVEETNPVETDDVTDISLSWPLNKQEGKTARDDEGHCHVFLTANHVQDPVTGEWSKTCACGAKEPLEKVESSIGRM